jgi:hypothetical protein
LLRVLRSSLRGAALPADIATLADHPDEMIRLYVVGIRWTEDGDVPATRAAALEALRSSEAYAVSMGCQLLMQLGPAAGDVVPLVWDHLRHPKGFVRGNAGNVLLQCCPDTRILAEAAGVLEAEPGGEGLEGAIVRYVAHRLRKAVMAEQGAAPDPAGG